MATAYSMTSTCHCDHKKSEEIQNIWAQMKQENLDSCIVAHNEHEKHAIIDRADISCDGKILLAGDSNAIATDPKARQVFLDERFLLNR